MGFGFDISDNNVVQPNKKVIEPVNIVDTTNPPDSGGGNRTDTDYSDPNRSWTTEDVIPNIGLMEDAKGDFLESLPEKQKPFAYLGIGVLAYYLFLS